MSITFVYRDENNKVQVKKIERKKMNNTALIYDITFYQVDEEGNDLLDDKGNTKVFRIKDGLRFKPLEYLCDDIDVDILEEVK